MAFRIDVVPFDFVGYPAFSLDGLWPTLEEARAHVRVLMDRNPDHHDRRDSNGVFWDNTLGRVYPRHIVDTVTVVEV